MRGGIALLPRADGGNCRAAEGAIEAILEEHRTAALMTALSIDSNFVSWTINR
jgi:hypothetical protein